VVRRTVVRVLRFVLVAVAVVALGVVDAGDAMACSCGRLGGAASDEQHFVDADAVFEGTVVDSRIVRDPGGLASSTDPEVITFAVSEAYKGRVAERQSVVTEESEASCGLDLRSDVAYVVFAVENGGALSPVPVRGQYYAGLCGGTRPLTAGPLASDLTTCSSEPQLRDDGRAAALEQSSDPASFPSFRWPSASRWPDPSA
jgi:hypothetical protein